jgi:uncharacterized protein YkwD
MRETRVTGRSRWRTTLAGVVCSVVTAGGLLVAAPPAGAQDAVDTTDLADVVTEYREGFEASAAAVMGAVGDTGSCTPGATSAAYAQATVRMLNYFRVMAGLLPVANDAGLDARAQQAAMVMLANQSLSHAPPASWRCWNATAAEAAARSNLSLGEAGPDAVAGQFRDAGANNTAVGHRRWILYPRLGRIGVGSVGDDRQPNLGRYTTANAVWIVEDSGARVAASEWVSWPMPGFVPYQVAYARWSLARNGSADFSGATVSMRVNGEPAALQVLPYEGTGIGDPTLVWQPTVYANDRADGVGLVGSTIDVTVDGIRVGTATTSRTYQIVVVDPNAYPFISGGQLAVVQYLDFLFRLPDLGGLLYWADQILTGRTTGPAVAESFLRSPEFSGRVAPIVRLYLAALDRFPDRDGVTYWAQQAAAGRPLASIAAYLAASPEFVARYGALDDAAFVDRVYVNVLGRPADDTGRAYWTGRLAGGLSRGDLVLGFAESAEHRAATDPEVLVAMTYLGMLRREPDAGGLAYWSGLVRQGLGIGALVAGLYWSPEYAARFT